MGCWIKLDSFCHALTSVVTCTAGQALCVPSLEECLQGLWHQDRRAGRGLPAQGGAGADPVFNAAQHQRLSACLVPAAAAMAACILRPVKPLLTFGSCCCMLTLHSVHLLNLWDSMPAGPHSPLREVRAQLLQASLVIPPFTTHIKICGCHWCQPLSVWSRVGRCLLQPRHKLA